MAVFSNPYENDGVTTKGLLMAGYGLTADGGNVCSLHGGGLFGGSTPTVTSSFGMSGPSTPAPA